MQKRLIFLLLILLGQNTFGQDSIASTEIQKAQYKPELWIQGNLKGGFLIAHRSVMGHLVSQHAIAGEVGVVFQTRGRRYWNQAYKYPRIALNMYVGNLGHDDILGHSFGLYSCASMPLASKKWYEFSAKAGVGLVYMNKRYHQQNNPLNIGISTPINVLVLLGIESRFKIKNNSAITLSLDATHFSNGATTVPNFGLNLPFVSIGYQHKIQQSNWVNQNGEVVSFDRTDVIPNQKRWEFGVMAIGSVKEIFPVNQKKYGIFGLNLIGRRFFNQKVGMEMSFDLMSNQSIRDFNAEIEKTFAEMLQLGVYTGYILPLDKFHAIVGMGVYVRDKYKPADLFYHRVGMRYVFKNGINMNLTLKSHWARADYVEYGIGYTFKK